MTRPQDDPHGFRHDALDALRRIGHANAVPGLKAVLAGETDQAAQVRRVIAELAAKR